ncbi:MAG TPA: hypothetical protein VJL80_10015 [Aeromicrobium sp.]|nr:hypothetical protein [Aeromicrobium sp.]HKY58362.1 hypothetical protein [Aeromicrobium sp.]
MRRQVWWVGRTRGEVGHPTHTSPFETREEAERFAATCGYPLTIIYRGYLEDTP